MRTRPLSLRRDARPYPFNPDRLVNRFYQFSPPTRFGERYGTELKQASNVTVLFNANATRIKLTANAALADYLDLRSLSGKSGRVKARHYVPACGGIENARLLLASNDVASAGVGNSKDIVGRYFMDHLYGTVGSLLVSERPEQFLAQYGEITPTSKRHPLSKSRSLPEAVPFQAAMGPSADFKRRSKTGGVALFVRGDWSRTD